MAEKRSVEVTTIGVMEILTGAIGALWWFTCIFWFPGGRKFGYLWRWLVEAILFSSFLLLGIGVVLRKRIAWFLHQLLAPVLALATGILATGIAGMSMLYGIPAGWYGSLLFFLLPLLVTVLGTVIVGVSNLNHPTLKEEFAIGEVNKKVFFWRNFIVWTVVLGCVAYLFLSIA